jgi:methyl-accepting chemotaxis protein
MVGMSRSLGLRPKMAAQILLVAVLMLLVSVLYIGYRARALAREQAEEATVEVARHWAAVIQADMQTAMDTARTLAQSMEGLKSSGMPPRHVIDGMLKSILEEYPNYIAVWTCWEPNALDGRDKDFVNAVGSDKTGRFIPYWNRLGGTIDVQPLSDYDTGGLGDYYLVPLETGREFVSNPVKFEINGEKQLKTVLAVPIQYKGKNVGVVGIDIPLKSLEPIIKRVRFHHDDGYGFLIANNGVFAAHPTRWSNVGKPMEYFKFQPASIQAVKNGLEATEEKLSKTSGKDALYAFAPVRIGSSDKPWSLATNIPLNVIYGPANGIVHKALWIGFAGILLLAGIVWFGVVGRITRPIIGFANTIRQVARERDLTLDVPATSSDEIGMMGREFNNMMKSLRDSFGMVEDAARSGSARHIKQGPR